MPWVPGAVFIAFVACGWTRVPLGLSRWQACPFPRFYLPIMLYLVIVSGDALDDHVGLWAWPVLLVVTAALGFIRWRVFTFQSVAQREGAVAVHAAGGNIAAYRGHPRRATASERIRPALFCLPLIASWVRLGWRYRR